MIRFAKIDDYSEITKLYNKNSKNLGRYFKDDLVERITNHRFYLYILNDIIVGFCSYDIMKRKPSIQINYLCTNIDYRGRHIATDLIKKIIEDTKHLGLYYYAECLDGLDNNSFYDKIGKLDEIVDKQKYKIRRYILYGNKELEDETEVKFESLW